MTLFFSLLAAVALTGCSVAEQDAADVGENFRRGIKGEGRIVPNDPTSDAFGADYQWSGSLPDLKPNSHLVDGPRMANEVSLTDRLLLSW
jgi:hypothetical protein